MPGFSGGSFGGGFSGTGYGGAASFGSGFGAASLASGPQVQHFSGGVNSSLYDPGGSLTNSAVPIGSYLDTGGSSGGSSGTFGSSGLFGGGLFGGGFGYGAPRGWALQSPLSQPELTADQRLARQQIMAKYSQNYRHPGYAQEMSAWHSGLGRSTGAATVAAPTGDATNPSAFNGQGYDSTSAFINDLVAQISGGGSPTTTGWFDLAQRPLNLFGSAY